ncbi:uncharacterized protein LOC124939100 [Impatiens glandulifera]|uniref:uncharacterized protein LOC124939100 n=1 Tax=Impatiens glandulifera TaxID=253017 RepID=UPI001FB0C47F|nr:uncharacterized protein LOC124939100 [Impatiens glandulifera]
MDEIIEKSQSNQVIVVVVVDTQANQEQEDCSKVDIEESKVVDYSKAEVEGNEDNDLEIQVENNKEGEREENEEGQGEKEDNMLIQQGQKGVQNISINFNKELMGTKKAQPEWIRKCVSTSRFVVSVNEIHGGHFKGENGVRQGDPLSSSLFVVIVAIFESVFTTFRKNQPYIFHPFCEEKEITHLYFTDDLFILAHADIYFIKTVTAALTFYFEVIGLTINENKSLAFYGGVKQETKANIYNIMDITEGSFPIRYLDILLTAKQIQILHYKPLIEKVNNSISN